MSYYVIQSKAHHWDTAWTTWPDRRFDTLEAAQAPEDADSGLPLNTDCRIAKAYTVTMTRYKPVKGGTADGG